MEYKFFSTEDILLNVVALCMKNFFGIHPELGVIKPYLGTFADTPETSQFNQMLN